MNYCGTCKAVGADYSAKARLTLNNDAVFLAEILGVLAGETFESSTASLKSRNCLSIPESAAIPRSLRFAAATNIALAGLKLEDHAVDGDRAGSGIARRALRSDVEKAFESLSEWNFPLVEIRDLLASQSSRELSFVSLDEVIFPTADTTAAFFREGAKFVGRDDVSARMYEVGFAFGRLVYLIDAFEDFEKDSRRGKFNAFRTAFGSEIFDKASKRRAAALIRAAERNVLVRLRALPIDESRVRMYSSRLASNVAAVLGTELPVLKHRHRRISLSERWHAAVANSKRIASGYGWQMPLVFVFVLLFAIAAPAQTREAKSAGECAQLGFNLMFLGSIFAAVVSFPRTILIGNRARRRMQEKGTEPSLEDEEKSSWCDWCECCECDECCCECDWCDCCSGCCDCSCD